MTNMGKMQRTKGANGEREVTNLLKKYGFSAKRISMMETNGTDKGDVELTVDDIKSIVSVKIGAQVPKFHYDALGEADYLFARRDRSKWLVTMDIDTFIFLLMKKNSRI